MPSNTQFDQEFNRLMKTVKILRGHFSRIYGEIEEELIRLRFRKDRTGHTRLNTVRRQMRADYDDALGLIASQITSVEELRRTRHVLRGAADKAFKFVEQMRKIKKKVGDFAKAAKVLSEVLTGLRKILV